MPIYCFRCPICEETKELVFSINDMELIKKKELFPLSLRCNDCFAIMQRDYSLENLSFQFGRENGSFKDKYSHKRTGYSRSMPEMIKYFQRHEPEKMKGNKGKTIKDYKSEKLIIIPK